MNRTLALAARMMLLVAAVVALTACPKKAPQNAVQAQPTPAPTAAPAETRVPPPPPPPTQAVAVSPIAGSLAELNSKGYLKDAFFDYDKADLRDDARATLAGDADWLKKFPSLQVLIEGHCDERGTSAYNLSLGDRRANAARDYLASLGVEAMRMKTVSYGKERPICSESSEGCWQRNRRAAFVITAK
ncbi:MAG: peptidoglycan-associated lipoprotein Pal [Thermoanaerobaculia bacterium]